MSSRGAYLKDVLSLPPLSIEVLDIGAAALGRDRCEPLISQGIANVTGFEPNADELRKLRKRKGRYTYLPHCLGDGTTRPFYLTRFPGCSSLLRPDPAVIDRFVTILAGSDGGDFHVYKETEVQTVRLDDIGLSPKPDFVKVDVQGGELLVLENGTETLSEAQVLEVEVEFVPLYEDQPLFGDIHTFLSGQGFVLHKLLDVSGRGIRPIANPRNPFLPVSQILWADAVFVKDYFRLDGYSDDQLYKAAIVLHDVYRSYDLVYLLLNELGKRRECPLCGRYGEFLTSGQAASPQFMTIRSEP